MPQGPRELVDVLWCRLVVLQVTNPLCDTNMKHYKDFGICTLLCHLRVVYFAKKEISEFGAQVLGHQLSKVLKPIRYKHNNLADLGAVLKYYSYQETPKRAIQNLSVGFLVLDLLVKNTTPLIEGGWGA